MKKDWKKIDTERVFSCPYIKVDKSVFENNVGYRDDFFSLPFVDWVHIVPVFSDGRVLMIEMYRFGTECSSLEFPGGQFDPGDSPEEAAYRELLEETGYSAESLEYLGWSHPNPAIQANKCHFFKAENIKLVAKQDLEPAEDISIRIVAPEELSLIVKKGEIIHSLALTAYLKYIMNMKSL